MAEIPVKTIGCSELLGVVRTIISLEEALVVFVTIDFDLAPFFTGVFFAGDFFALCLEVSFIFLVGAIVFIVVPCLLVAVCVFVWAIEKVQSSVAVKSGARTNLIKCGYFTLLS